MPATILHSLVILISVATTYAWSKNPGLNYYNLQVTGLIIIFYFITRYAIKKLHRLTLLLDTTVFTCLTLLLVLTTGGVHSPVFFLLYFLLFALSLLFEPLQSTLVTLSLLVIFALESITKLDNLTLINLLTLILITPLAIILGNKYLETLESLGKIQILKNIISKEETDSLLWLSTQAKPSLTNVISSLGDILAYMNNFGGKIVPASLLEKLKRIHTDLILLYKSTDTLKDTFKEIEDEKIKL